MINQFTKIRNFLKRENFFYEETEKEIEINLPEYFLISTKWVSSALPFIEEYIYQNKNLEEDDFFNPEEIIKKYSLMMNKSEKIQEIQSIAYPWEINNDNIIRYKDYWYDYDDNFSHTNIFLSEKSTENQDFFYLTKKNWEIVKNIFGCLNEIKRFNLKESNIIDIRLKKVKNKN